MPENSGAIFPIIQVEISDFEYNARSVAELLNIEQAKNKSLPFKEHIFNCFPVIKAQYHEDMSDEEVDLLVKKVLDQEYLDNSVSMESRRIELQDKLCYVLHPIINKMLDLFEVKWPREQQVITCYLGFYPVFPRNVITKEYWIHYQASDEVIQKASVHEINHFIFFEKWKSMHGYEKSSEPMHPEPLWYLEEMIIGPTLNHPEILRVSPYPQKAYQSFYDNKINGISIEDNISGFFDKRRDIADFLNKSYDFIESNIEQIITMCG